MLEWIKNLETNIKLGIFFGTVVISLFSFTLNSYVKITKGLELITQNQQDLRQLILYKDITMSSYIENIYIEVVSDGSRNTTSDEIKILNMYYNNLYLNINDKVKIEQILNNWGDNNVQNDKGNI